MLILGQQYFFELSKDLDSFLTVVFNHAVVPVFLRLGFHRPIADAFRAQVAEHKFPKQ